MPYPALPPELPPLASVSVVNPAQCSRLSDAEATGLTAQPDKNAGSQPVSSKPASAIAPAASSVARPETFSPSFSSPQTAPTPAPSTDPLPGSCAAFLGNTTAAGYWSVSRVVQPESTPAAKSSPTTSSPPPIAPPASIGRLAALGRSPQTPAPAPLQPTRKPSAPLKQTDAISYSVTGVTGRLSDTPQQTLMQNMNQAILFDGLVETYQTLSSLTATDLARLAKTKSNRVAQATEDDTPGLANPVSPFPPGGPINAPTIQIPTPESGTPAPTPNPTDQNPAQPASPPVATPANVLEVTADRQEYDERRQVFTAEGKVMLRFQGALMDADRVQVNLVNRLAVAEGNVALTRGGQVLRGERFEYNFVQGTGTVAMARGDIYLPRAGADTTFGPPSTTAVDQNILARPLSDRVTSQQPLQNVTSPGGISISAGAGRNVSRVPGALPQGGEINRLRFEAETIDFTPEGWEATNIDITNDPFSPPELVLRADRATLTRISPLQDEVIATRPRLVFDQKVAIPLLQRRLLIDRTEREPGFLRFGVDSEDRGGVFLEGIFRVIQSPKVKLTIYPQIFLQRMFISDESSGVFDPDNFGIRASLGATLSPSTLLGARVSLTSFDPDKFEDELRASARIRQFFDTPIGVHTLAFEYSYRDRLFNGSLGFQTVQSSIGALLVSPNIVLGNSGLVLNYQVGYQGVTADTDRLDLLDAVRDNNRVTLGRFQTTASIGRSFILWQGKPLPATRDEGLNYTPNPIVPYISANATLRGVFSSYSNGDTQQDLIGTVGLFGQFGHFSRRFFDYTAFGVSYTQTIGSGESPFFFDRSVDNRILSLSAFQQVYGPLRVGVQTSFNVDTSEAISTDYFLEYSRRTHGIILRYNPVLEIGSISFRLSDFNWTGTGEPFEGTDVTPVQGGVRR